MTEDGTIVWRGKQQLWGREEGVNKEDAPVCRQRFSGQYEDEESRLYYNRFRYYDAETGQYLSPDPIGLLGGLNPYGYVANPLKYVDPLGLMCCPPNKKTTYEGLSRKDAFGQAKRDAGIPMSQHPDSITRPNLLDANGNKILPPNGQPIKTRQYEFTNKDGDSIFIQEHGLGHTNATSGHGLEPHFNVRPPENLNTGSVPGTMDTTIFNKDINMWFQNAIGKEKIQFMFNNELETHNIEIISFSMGHFSDLKFNFFLNQAPKKHPEKWKKEQFNTLSLIITFSEIIQFDSSGSKVGFFCSPIITSSKDYSEIRIEHNDLKLSCKSRFLSIDTILPYLDERWD